MARVPMGNFGNAMPQVERIRMPQQDNISASLVNASQVFGQAVNQRDKAQQEAEVSAKRLELYGNQLAEQEAKIKLDDALTTQMSEQVTLVKKDVVNGVYDAKAGDEALKTWGAAKYKELEQDMPMHARTQLQQYWKSNVDKEATSLLPLQLRADAQKGVVVADKAFDVATRYDREKGREYLKNNLNSLNISEAEKSDRLIKYDVTRDILDVDDRITLAVSGKDTSDLTTLISDLDGGKYGHLDGPTAQNKKNQALSRIDAINKLNEVEENKRVQVAGKVFNEYKSQVLTGRMLDDDYRNDVRKSVAGTEHEAEFDFYDKQSSNFQSFSRKSTSDQLALINQQKANMKNSSTTDAVTEGKILGVYESLYNEKLSTIKSNPNQAVREAGLEVHELTSVELKTNPNSFVKKAIENGVSQMSLKDANVKVLPISNEDLPEARKAFNDMGVDQKLNFIGGLIDQSKGVKNGAKIWGSLLGQLGGGSMNYVSAGLAQMNGFKSTENRHLATSIINGTQLLKNKQLIMPKEAELKTEFNKYVGNTLSGTSANNAYETFKAVYADTLNERAIQHKATDEAPNKDVLKTALGMATGGVYTQSGKHKNYLGESVKDWKVSKPYGWTDSKFESYINPGYERISKETGLPVHELESLRLHRSEKKTEKGEIQYDLINERGNPLQVKGVIWRISLPGATK